MGPKRSKGDRRRADLLTASRRLLVEEGYDRFVLRELATRLGVTLGHLQHYYATRDDLLEAVVRAEFAANQAEIAALADGGGTAEARLAAITRRLLDVWARDGGRVYAVMSFLALHQPRFRTLHGEIYAAFYASLLPVLREIRPRATRRELLDVARLVTTVIDGALVQLPSRTFVTTAIAAVRTLARG